MGLVRYEVRVVRVLDAPPDLVWGLVADTNRTDRAIGLAAARYRWDELEGRRVRVASARELGREVEWVEPPYQWVEGRFVQGRRDFRRGPVAEAGLTATLEEAGARTRVEVMMYFQLGGVSRLLAPIQRAKMKRALGHYLDDLERILTAPLASDFPLDAPASVRARHLLGSSYYESASGSRQPPEPDVFAARVAELRGAPIDAEVLDRLVSHLAERPDEEVSQMKPFELADRWSADRREVLRAFLYATTSGLTDLSWQVNCPVCKVGASHAAGLDQLGEQGHCETCQIHYDIDFAQHVEAVFPCNPAVRAVEPTLYCASSPVFLPHVFAQLEVPGGERREEVFAPPPGALYIRALGRAGGVEIELPGGPVELGIHTDGERLEARVEPLDEGPSRLRIDNRASADAVVLLERTGWAADAVLGTVIASFPEFVRLFATEAPASGVELRIGHIALLFSDLVGSTALYERVGDARAFALVEEHFRRARAAVEDAGGTVVKTMGDAVMASFPSLAEAVRAAVGMVRAQEAASEGAELGVKVGVHGGPCLAVRANDRLDYFGTTVNLAARLQARAEAGELVLTDRAASAPGVEEALDGAPARRFDAELKGIENIQHLYAFDVRAGRGPRLWGQMREKRS